MAFLFGCLSFLTFQQIGSGVSIILNTAFFQKGATDVQTLASAEGHNTTQSLANDYRTLTCEAALTERRTKLCSSMTGRFHVPSAQASFFHSNVRPATLRMSAVFCDFSLLRCALHAHFRFLSNATSVLC